MAFLCLRVAQRQKDKAHRAYRIPQVVVEDRWA
jgi:hypothetical protein